MSKASMHSFKLGRARSSAPMIDKYAIVPMSACVFALIVSPLLVYVRSGPAKTLQSISEPALENRIFWPAMAAISVVLAVQNRSHLGKLPPPIICLLAYLAFAGASVLRAFEPEVSFIRFASQVMVVLSIILLPCSRIERWI